MLYREVIGWRVDSPHPIQGGDTYIQLVPPQKKTPIPGGFPFRQTLALS
ncbi:hypothetical protein LEP1GSC196_2236 [Leptospira meyeri serovar Semaranga str. Veldrot Semarang 173]|nr:hypothetical protein LEP1GSC196_2236 [Leptospira meyeri serovar Semaranga str. Veldrot Semarang 173]